MPVDDLGSLGLASSDKHDSITTQFKVVIGGLREMVFKSCEGLEAQVEVLSFPEGGSLNAPRTGRGQMRVNLISFGQGSTSAPSGRTIFDWFKEVMDASHNLEKKTLSIALTNLDKKVLAEWQVSNAWPCRWRAPVMNEDSSNVGIEYVTFAHEGIDRTR